MDPNWNDNQPIYRQLRDRMVALILEGALKEGDPLPSVRAVAADYRLNPLTVLKGYQQLVDERLVEKRRGRGMYVSEGARRLLLAGRERSLSARTMAPDSGGNPPPGILRAGAVCPDSRAHPSGPAAPRRRGKGRLNSSCPPLIEARDLSKKYGSQLALNSVNFSVEAGRIVGLIGPNGAGKTSALRAILGLTAYEGPSRRAGARTLREPRRPDDRRRVSSPTSPCCPPGFKVDQAIDFVAGVHPRFRRDRALALLAKTQIAGSRRIRELSKGMKTLVHLALTMAIDARLLVLDEPTLGLDILARRSFYDALVNDYMDDDRTILITTHQVEEVENLLTDVLFIDKGRIASTARLTTSPRATPRSPLPRTGCIEARAALRSTSGRMLGKTMLYFEQPDFARLAAFGEVRRPSVSDLFVAKLS